MLLFSDELNEVKRKVKIVDVISEHLDVHKRNDEITATCPFCDGGDTFKIYPDNKNYCCGKCGCKGDAIQFIMEYKGMSFSEAIDYLAKKYDVKLEKIKRKKIIGKIRIEYDGRVIFFEKMEAFEHHGNRIMFHGNQVYTFKFKTTSDAYDIYCALKNDIGNETLLLYIYYDENDSDKILLSFE